MKKTVVIVLCLILSTATVSADFNVQIEDGFNIIAGNSETVNLTLTSDKKVTVHLSYNITPDDVGFNITFSDNDFTFKETKIIKINISTDIYLEPISYTITYKYKYKIEEPTTNHKSSGSGIIIVKDDATDDSDNNEEEQSNDTNDTNDTEDDENLTSYKKKEDNNIFLPLIITFIISVFIVFIIWYRRKKKDK